MTRIRRTYTPDQDHRSFASAGPKAWRCRRTSAFSASSSAGIDHGSRSHRSTLVKVISCPLLGPKHTRPRITAGRTSCHEVLDPTVSRPHPPSNQSFLLVPNFFAKHLTRLA